jgi:ATP-dependent RNA helicase DHX37/DHR1
MEEIHKLRAQISSIVHANFPSTDVGFTPNIPPPKINQLKALRQLIAASFIDQVAVRKDLVQPSSATGNKYASCRGVAFCANGVTEDVFIHPSSVLFHTAPPDYVVFQEVIRGTKVWIKSKFLLPMFRGPTNDRPKALTVINAAWIAPLGNVLCTFSKPIPVPLSMKDAKPGEVLVVPKYGPGWELPPIRKMKD